MDQRQARVLIGSRIREARVYRGMRQVELAAKLFMSQPTLSGIEKGRHGIDVALLRCVSEVLGVSVLYLMGYPKEVCKVANPGVYPHHLLR